MELWRKTLARTGSRENPEKQQKYPFLLFFCINMPLQVWNLLHIMGFHAQEIHWKACWRAQINIYWRNIMFGGKIDPGRFCRSWSIAHFMWFLKTNSQLLSGIISFLVWEVHWPYLKRCMTNISCPNSPFEGYPLWGKSWRRRSTLNISYLNGVYKVDDCFPGIPD